MPHIRMTVRKRRERLEFWCNAMDHIVVAKNAIGIESSTPGMSEMESPTAKPDCPRKVKTTEKRRCKMSKKPPYSKKTTVEHQKDVKKFG